ncbi:MAG: DUF58 domain-containing protein [Burkholderiales bacterium]
MAPVLQLKNVYYHRLNAWSLKRNGVQSGPVRLTQRRIYILPTRHGMLFALLLLLLLIGSINYGLGLGFVLTFLLVSMGVVSILHTWRNLAGLWIQAIKNKPVFAGDDAAFEINVENKSGLYRYSIGLKQNVSSQPAYINVPPRQQSQIALRIATEKRGWLQAPRFHLFTEYPLGLLYAWTYVYLDTQCLVYPRPENNAPSLPLSGRKTGGAARQEIGHDDFASLRNFRAGDSPKHVAWKAAAQEKGLLTKQFSGESGGEVWLDFTALEGLDTEGRLSRLTRWVLDADKAQLHYGLRLPNKNVGLAHGADHRMRCLEALALYGAD